MVCSEERQAQHCVWLWTAIAESLGLEELFKG